MRLKLAAELRAWQHEHATNRLEGLTLRREIHIEPALRVLRSGALRKGSRPLRDRHPNRRHDRS